MGKMSNKEDFDFKSFLKSHFLCILASIFFLTLSIIGIQIRATAKSDYQKVFDQLNELKNQINHDSLDVSLSREYEVTELVGGLDKERWKEDDELILDWVRPAFTFENSEEYNNHREIYVERLGQADDFVMEVMPPYIANYTELENENSEINDGTSINMKVVGLKSFVDSVDGDVYSYVAVLTCASTTRKGETNESNVILTYSIDGSKSIFNFHAATPYIKA